MSNPPTMAMSGPPHAPEHVLTHLSCAELRGSPIHVIFFALRHRGRVRAGGGPGLADLLVHLRDLLADRRELRMPGDLPPHPGHLPGSQLPPDGAASPGGP